MWIIWFIILLIILIVFVVISWNLCSYVIISKGHTYEDIIRKDIEQGAITQEEIDSFHKVPFTYTLPDHVKLQGEWIYPDQKSDKIMIISHGFTSNLCADYKYAKLFLKRGFTVLIYDNRHWGKNQARYTTLGYKESQDLKKIVDYVYQIYDGQCKVATHGESMGAAAVLLHAAIDSRVRFVVADCPFADLSTLLGMHLTKDFHLPEFPFLILASLICKIRAGFFFHEVSPYRAIVKADGLKGTPVLFIHGDEDDFIPKDSSEKMFSIKQGDASIYLCSGAKHAMSYKADPVAYDNEIEKFLSTIGE